MCGPSQIGTQTRINTSLENDTIKQSSSRETNERPTTRLGQTIPRPPNEVRREGTQNISSPGALKRRAGACLVGVGVVGLALLKIAKGGLKLSRGVAAVGTLGISEGLYRGGRAICKAIYNKVSGRNLVPDQPLSFTLPGTDNQSVTLNASILPKRMARNMTIGQLTEIIQTKINSGHQLLQDIANNALEGKRCSVEDMTNIMFYLQAKGESKVGNFSQGSFSIPDPDNKIRNFLDSCKKTYQRTSSHVNGFQELQGGRHRGIDAYGSCKHSETLLPHGMKTLLYGSLDKNDDLQMPKNMLWLKIESHGAWLTAPKGGRDAQGPGRTANRHDAGAMLGHTFSFLATRGKGSLEGSHKERIPSDIKNSFNELVKNAPTEIKDILNRNNPTAKAMGVRVMYQNAIASLPQIPVENPELNKAVMNFILTLEDTFSNLDVRIGNEVIFTDSEIGISSTRVTSTTSDVQQGNDSQEIFETIIQPEVNKILQQDTVREEKVQQLLNLGETVHLMGLDSDIDTQATGLLRKEINILLDAQEVKVTGDVEIKPFVLPETLNLSDIKQSQGSNVCYILSTIASVLNTDWGENSIKNMIEDQGNTIKVTFPNSEVVLNKEGLFASDHQGSEWVQVLEKACTQYLGKGVQELGSLDEIPNAFGWKNSEVPTATELSNISDLASHEAKEKRTKVLLDVITTALSNGKAVTYMRSGHAVALTEFNQSTNTLSFHNSLREEQDETNLDDIVTSILSGKANFCVIEKQDVEI